MINWLRSWVLFAILVRIQEWNNSPLQRARVCNYECAGASGFCIEVAVGRSFWKFYSSRMLCIHHFCITANSKRAGSGFTLLPIMANRNQFDRMQPTERPGLAYISRVPQLWLTWCTGSGGGIVSVRDGPGLEDWIRIGFGDSVYTSIVWQSLVRSTCSLGLKVVTYGRDFNFCSFLVAFRVGIATVADALAGFPSFCRSGCQQ